MANRLTDDELRQSLVALGENVGPITPNTRSVLERRLVNLRKTKGIKFAALNALSSDDSEIENASTSTRKKRTHIERPSPPGEIFKKPATVHIPVISQDKRLYQRSKKPKRNNRNSSFDIETSDSDFDSDVSSPGRSPGRPRRKPALEQVATTPEIPRLRRREVGESSDTPFQTRTPTSSWNSTSNHGLLQFSPPSQKREEPHMYHPPSNGYLPSTTNNGDTFVAKGSSTNHSHCVSWILVLGAIAFFVTVGVLYISEVQKNNQQANKNNSKPCLEFEEELCPSFFAMCKELHSLLSRVAGDFECGLRNKRNLTTTEAEVAIKDFFATDTTFMMENFAVLFKKSVAKFCKEPQWDIKCYPSTTGDVNSTDIALEAGVASKSLWCRVRLSIRWTAARILFLLGFAVSVMVCWLLWFLWRKRRDAQETLFFEMVEKVIDMLQESQDSDNCKAVVNIRDALISPKERKYKAWLWDRVVSFVEESESRVSVEHHIINGEDFKVWRWHASSENDGGKHGKVWQGQAFGNVSKGKSAVYSPCLKIRNMFDSEAEYGDSWQLNIQDAILEKCEGNDGIRHIAMESSNNEGCVYMLCDSTESSGKAYNDLHGWWFDGKLITVKYIPLKRYLERFPSAAHLTMPLRPSNDQRRSLARPFFSSALERS